MALVTLTDPEVGAKLPSRDSYVGVDDDAFAEAVIQVLEAEGLKPEAKRLEKAKAKRLELERKYDEAAGQTKVSTTHNAATEIAQLKLLIQEADVLIKRKAPPGSPVYGLIKPPATKKKASSDGKSSSTAHPGPAPVAKTPTPAPAPVAVQPTPTPAGGDATAIAPLVNGASGTQVNGAAR